MTRGERAATAWLPLAALVAGCVGGCSANAAVPARTPASSSAGATASHASGATPHTSLHPATAAPPAPLPPSASSAASGASTASAASTCTGSPADGIVWRDDVALSVFWAIDEASMWNDRGGNAYASFFHDGLPPHPGDEEALAAYAKLRRAYSREKSSPDPDVTRPIDMLPPRMLPADAFAEAFSCTADPVAAAARLGMHPDEQRTVHDVFDRFRPRLLAAITASGYLPRATPRLRALATRSDMRGFLDEMRAFYGSEELPRPLYVDVLWTPPSRRTQATAIGAHMVVPIPEKGTDDDKGLAGWLGVVVHEFGHQMLAYVSEERRYALSLAIVAEGGILQRRHPNVVDEALQAAFGNLLFLRERLPEGLDLGSVYAFEPELEYPDLIDSLARRVEPLVKDALARHAHLDDAFIRRVIVAQAEVAPPRLAHMSRVAIVWTPSAHDRADFEGMLWGRSRFFVSDAKDLGSLSRQAPAIARWAVATTPEVGASGGELDATFPAARQAARDLDTRHAAACVRATRRASGAWDVAVVGRDRAGVRRALIGVQRGIAPDAAHPSCVR